MGHSSSRGNLYNGSPEHIVHDTVGVLQDEVLRHARQLTEIATLTYDDFQASLGQLNALSRAMTDAEGNQLLFAVKKGTDSTVLWRGTIKIACVKLDPKTNKIESYRLLNLNQFLKVFKTLECQMTASAQSTKKEKSRRRNRKNSNNSVKCLESDSLTASSEEDESSYQDSDTDSSISKPIKSESQPKIDKQATGMPGPSKRQMTATMLLEEVDTLTNAYSENCDKLGECTICLERKLDVMLPCAHAYCLVCIEQWNTFHKTCPICRETISSTDDTWVISDMPESNEINEEICSALMKLTTDG